MNHAKGVLPDPVIRDYRANAMLVFADIDPALDQAGIQNLLQQLSQHVETARAEEGPDGEPVTSIAVALGSSFFGSSNAPRFGIPPGNIPGGFAEPTDLGPVEETLTHDLLLYVLTTAE